MATYRMSVDRAAIRVRLLCPCVLLIVAGTTPATDKETTVDIVALDQMRRIEMIERITPASVCIYDGNKRGGGSGVLIDTDGYGITNYHVVAKMLGERRGWGGLGDGEFYKFQVLGIDPTGDIAMFRLLDEQRFPSVPLGNSDTVRVGDPVVVLGDPFVLSEDNMPTVTTGIITGVHRYQGGTKGNLVYSDCLQTDASINPGNSGGPLFNERGQVIGINGRISVGERGRFNVGHGYAISSNQIRRFIPALRAGLLARHGTLHATVKEKKSGAVVFDEVGFKSPAREAGIRAGDRLVSLDGVEITSANHYISIMGTYPEDWPVTLVVQRGSQRIENVIRLMPVDPKINFEYIADRDVNVRQIERVLRRFNEATRTKWHAAPAVNGYVWEVALRGDATLVSDRQAGFKFRIVHPPSGSARLELVNDSDTQTVITFDGIWAEKPDGEMLLPQRQMACNALYYLQSLLVTAAEETAMDAIEHVGGDFPIATSQQVPLGGSAETPWDVLSWQTPGGLTIKISFDPVTGFARRVRAFDPASRDRVSIELRNHQELGEVTWPRTLEVSGPDYRFSIEVLSVERLP